MSREGSFLFLKKKKQKNFTPVRAVAPPAHPPQRESFLVLFFKKELLPSFNGIYP
jgi:hypothetical protein